MNQRLNYVIIFFFAALSYVSAQGIKGSIIDENGEPLPFASIYVKEASTGTSANVDGNYQLQLPSGSYHITIQFIGYAAQTKQIQVKAEFIELNVVLKAQSITLNTVTVTEDAEDPAYTIMRKAIAKSKYHLLQTNSYSAEVYTKGTAQLHKIPWPFRGMAKEEGIDTNRAFTSESISEIYFERPNTFKEKIISVRVSGQDDKNANPNAYINSSFYLPEVVGAVSPLSPRAFSYYRFHYVGSFIERSYEINKIKVTPRTRGENVFDGIIYIREKFWNIHSLELTSENQGFTTKVSQIYGPIVGEIWMPVTQKYNFRGSFLGAEIEYNYLASVSNYQVEVNTDLPPDVEVIDEKIEEVPEEVKNEKIAKAEIKDEIKEDKKRTRKQLVKMIDEYEKQEEAESEEEKNVVSNTWYEVDSTATKKDSAYWAEKRPVPLTEVEKIGYKKDDSTYVAAQADTLKKQGKSGFDFGDVFFGGNYKVGEKGKISFNGFLPEFRFNTVEGFNLDFAGTYSHRSDSNVYFYAAPRVRYGFSSTRLYGSMNTGLNFGDAAHRNFLYINGGQYIYQFYKGSIDPLINSLYTLFLARNYMKLYAQSFVDVGYTKQLNYKYKVTGTVLFAERMELVNHTDYSFFKPNNREYLTNEPVNAETPATGFNQTRVFKTGLVFNAQPWLKYKRRNGKLYPIQGSSPEITMRYNAGWDGVLESTSDFQQIEIGYKMAFKLGVRASIDFNAEAGTFLSNNNVEFVDYKHFYGGQTEIAPLSLTGNYRLLDYYLYSTQTSYASLFSHIRFRKFLFTQIALVRISGIKENLFFNYLKTDFSPNYWEVGYTIDQIFRLFRLEFVHSFNDFTPNQFGIRIGVSSLVNFSN